MAFGYINIRSQYTPYSIYLQGTISRYDLNEDMPPCSLAAALLNDGHFTIKSYAWTQVKVETQFGEFDIAINHNIVFTIVFEHVSPYFPTLAC